MTTPATKFELTLETVGALMAAPAVAAFYWALGEHTEGVSEIVPGVRAPAIPPVIETMYDAITATITGVAGFLPRLVGLNPPDWYLVLVFASAGAAFAQFRTFREIDVVPKAPKPAQFALGALYVLVAAYTGFGLAALMLNYFRLSFAWRVWMNGTDEAASQVAAPAMHAFYFLFVFVIASVAFALLHTAMMGWG